MHGSDPTTPSVQPSPPRPIPRRMARIARRRPNTRTMIGALLVSVAALVTYLAVEGSGSSNRRTVVVASRAIAPGERLDASALVTESIDDGPLSSHAFADPTPLVGAVTLAPIAEGELVQRSAVQSAVTSTPAREFSFPVDRDRALNGDLRPGERVDVLATYGSGNDSTTVVLSRDARVVRIADARSGAIGSSARLILTLALSSADQLLDTAHAAQTAAITVVRTTLAGDTSGARSATTGPLARSIGSR